MNSHVVTFVFVCALSATGFGFRDLLKDDAESDGAAMLAKAREPMDWITVNGITIQKLAGGTFEKRSIGEHEMYYAALPAIGDFAANVSILSESIGRNSVTMKEYIDIMKSQYSEMNAIVDVTDRSFDSATLLVRHNILWCYQKIIKDDFNRRFVIVTGTWKHSNDKQAIKICVDSANLVTRPMEGIGVVDLQEKSEDKVQRNEMFRNLNAAYESERLGRNLVRRPREEKSLVRDEDVKDMASDSTIEVREEFGFAAVWWYKKEIKER